MSFLEVCCRGVALATALVLAGCSGKAPEPGAPVVFDPCAPLRIVAEGAAPAELEAVAAGIALWNRALVARLTSAEQGPAGDPGAELPLRFQDAAAVFHGLYDDQRGIVFINHALGDPHERAVTIAHEIGHAFGLPHVPRETRASLMNPGNLLVEPTAEDVAAVVALWGTCN